MKIISLFIVCLSSIAICAETLHWSDALNELSRWAYSGKLMEYYHSNWSNGFCFTFPCEDKKRGVELHAERKPGKTDDLYGKLNFPLHDYESLKGAGSISFDAKVILEKNGQVKEFFLTAGGNNYPITVNADGKLHPVKIAFSGDLSECRNIGISFKASGQKWKFGIRNVKIDAVKAANEPYKYPIDTALALRAKVYGAAFYPDEALEFNCIIPQDAAYTIKDVYGKTVQTGILKPGKNILKMLPVGYYFLNMDDGKKFFNTRSIAVVERRIVLLADRECSFSIGGDVDFARARPDVIPFPGMRGYELPEIASRMGLFTLRSTYNLFDYYNYAQDETKKRIHRYMADDGVKVSQLVCPCFSFGRMENDLAFVYNSMVKHTQHWSDSWKFIEFWNEPETFGKPTAWGLAAIAKAAYLGIKKSAPALPVQSPSFFAASFPRELFKSGFHHYFDIYNIHVYVPMEEWKEYIENHHKLLKEYGIDDRPFHITECGTHGDGSAELPSYRKNMKMHSPRQEIIVAEFFVKSQVLMQSYGVDLNYNFCFAAYNEIGGGKDWGALRYDNSAKIIFASFSNLIKTLADAKYLGTYDLTAGSSAFLYEKPDGSQTLVFWDNDPKSEWNKNSQYARLHLPDGKYTIKDNYGFSRQVTAKNNRLLIGFNKTPSYLCGISGLKASRPAMVKTGNYKRPANLDMNVIINAVCSKDFSIAFKKNYAEPKKENAHMKVQLYNFDTVAKSGTISFAGAKVRNAPGTITLPPMGKVEFDLEVTPAYPGKDYKVDFAINGIFNGKNVTPCVVPMVNSKRIITKAVPLDYQDISRIVDVGSGKVTHKLSADKTAVEFTFIPDRKRSTVAWCYPQYHLKEHETFKDAVGIMFDIKFDDDTATNYWYSNIWFGYSDGTRQRLPVLLEMNNKWQSKTLHFMERLTKLPKVNRIDIGSEFKEFKPIRFSVKNVKVLYRAN